jgi:hypothetical protein
LSIPATLDLLVRETLGRGEQGAERGAYFHELIAP